MSNTRRSHSVHDHGDDHRREQIGYSTDSPVDLVNPTTSFVFDHAFSSTPVASALSGKMPRALATVFTATRCPEKKQAEATQRNLGL